MAVLRLRQEIMRYRVNQLLLVLMLAWLPSASVMAVEIVSHPGVSKSRLTVAELRAIFSMRLTHWSDSTPITVYVLPGGHPLHKEFSKKVLKLFPHQLQTTWDRLVYSGTGNAPTVVTSEEEMQRMLAATPGAIGYIDESKEHENIKTITLP